MDPPSASNGSSALSSLPFSSRDVDVVREMYVAGAETSRLPIGLLVLHLGIQSPDDVESPPCTR
eukprot:6208841-Pleurochrysis_carterae.AAC.2